MFITDPAQNRWGVSQFEYAEIMNIVLKSAYRAVFRISYQSQLLSLLCKTSLHLKTIINIVIIRCSSMSSKGKLQHQILESECTVDTFQHAIRYRRTRIDLPTNFERDL